MCSLVILNHRKARQIARRGHDVTAQYFKRSSTTIPIKRKKTYYCCIVRMYNIFLSFLKINIGNSYPRTFLYFKYLSLIQWFHFIMAFFHFEISCACRVKKIMIIRMFCICYTFFF